MEEIWKPIPGYEGYYEASSLGRIRSLDRRVKCTGKRGVFYMRKKGMIVKPEIDKGGYYQTSLSKDGEDHTKGTHVWVAMAHIPNPDNLPQVNHKDGNKQNNNIDNLEWCDASYNHLHAIETGLIKLDVTRFNAWKGADAISIRIKCEDTGELFASISDACRRLGKYLVNDNIHAGKRSHGGRGWLFTEVDEAYYEAHKNDFIDRKECDKVHDVIKQRIKSQGKAIPIYCVEQDRWYSSRNEAARENHVDNQAIAQAINEHRKCKGLTFLLSEDVKE